MEKLEREFLENGGVWKEFDFDKLFNVARGDIQNQRTLRKNDIGVSFVAQNDVNNGYAYKVSNSNYKKFKGNSIIIGRQTGVIYYQPEEFITTDGVLILEEKISLIKNKQVGLFICSLIKKHMVLYGYTNTVSARKLNDLKLALPFKNGKINFSYMEKFIEELEAERIEELEAERIEELEAERIEELEAERIEELEAYLVATGLKDYKLTKEDQKILDDFEKMSDNSLDRQTDRVKIGELFEIRPTKSYKLTNIKLYTEKGMVPVVTNTSYNNGIGGYSDLKPTENGNMITYSDTTTDSGIFYQPHDYIGYSHIQGLYSKNNQEYSRNELFYILTCFRVSARGRFDYANKFNRTAASSLSIELPFINNELDIEFMNRLIRVVEKLIIKDVVIWADKKIEATKQVVFKH